MLTHGAMATSGAPVLLGYVRDECLCPIRHKHAYAASLIILSNCRNSVVSLTFCSLLRGIIRSHGKQAKALQRGFFRTSEGINGVYLPHFG
jgi:hypothetical protein